MTTPGSTSGRVGVLWRGNPSDPDPELSETRLAHVFEALSKRGLSGVPVVYSDEAAERVGQQLLSLDAALVWVDPISDGGNRSVLDAMLRDVASHGVWVSTHPDVILKMGTKEVLVETRELGWGTDCRIYRSHSQLCDSLPSLLPRGPRVLKQHRGNDGNGVWKVELVAGGAVHVLEAQRRSVTQEMTLDAAIGTFAPYFQNGGCIVDQPYQDLTRGMMRCYLVQDHVAGFGQQYVTALAPVQPGQVQPLPQPRVYYGPSKPEYQALKQRLEREWVPQMQALLGIETDALPAIWDADFLYGPPDAAGQDTFVLCEINVSSVFPLPDEALDPLAEAVARGIAKRAG